MGTNTQGLVKQRQAPLRDLYARSPAKATIFDSAHTENACASDPFHGAVVPNHGSGEPLRFGIHRAVGGDHDLSNPGDLLCAGWAACLDATIRMVADHFGVKLASLQVTVAAECDVRGCLMVDPAVPVGFLRLHCSVRLAPVREVDSVMARRSFRQWWTRRVPKSVERSTCVPASSLALALLLWQWRPIAEPVILDLEHHAAIWTLQALFWLGWAVLLLSTFLISHLELFGLRQVVAQLRGQEIREPEFKSPPHYRHVRHPLYFGFAIAF